MTDEEVSESTERVLMYKLPFHLKLKEIFHKKKKHT